MVKHYFWCEGTNGSGQKMGRIAVILPETEGDFAMKLLWGKAPPAELLFSVVREVDPDGSLRETTLRAEVLRGGPPVRAICLPAHFGGQAMVIETLVEERFNHTRRVAQMWVNTCGKILSTGEVVSMRPLFFWMLVDLFHKHHPEVEGGSLWLVEADQSPVSEPQLYGASDGLEYRLGSEVANSLLMQAGCAPEVSQRTFDPEDDED